MRIEVVTLFPEFVAQAVRVGVLGRAIEAGRVAVRATTPREFAKDVHRTVDDRPYGGGPGMVLKVEPARTAIRAAKARLPARSRSIYLAADGERLTHALARELAQLPGLMLLAGRYEGVDERLIESEIDASVSIGDYVLSGGEAAALVLLDACIRLIPGVMGKEASGAEESFSAGLLEYPQYTRPAVFEGAPIPEILTGGDHGKVAAWRQAEAERLTRERRPDLWETYENRLKKPVKPPHT
jgi:tRNA (guanine37-N1)-methyltransferase